MGSTQSTWGTTTHLSYIQYEAFSCYCSRSTALAAASAAATRIMKKKARPAENTIVGKSSAAQD